MLFLVRVTLDGGVPRISDEDKEVYRRSTDDYEGNEVHHQNLILQEPLQPSCVV